MEKKLLNHYDKECMKMAMLKHEETFREQVYELHRLYQIQKLLMKEIARSPTNHSRTRGIQPELQQFNVLESGTTTAAKCGVVTTEIDDDDHHNNDLELTLGPKIYYKKKTIVNACEHAVDQSDSGPSFSSSSTGSCHVIKGRRNTRRDHHWPGLEIMPVISKNNNNNNNNNQDRLNSSPPWIFQSLSLNMTS